MADVVVAGHSLGCFTAPLAAALVDASLLVLVCPMIPAPAESARRVVGAHRLGGGAPGGGQLPGTRTSTPTSSTTSPPTGPRRRGATPSGRAGGDVGGPLAADGLAGRADAGVALPRGPVLPGAVRPPPRPGAARGRRRTRWRGATCRRWRGPAELARPPDRPGSGLSGPPQAGLPERLRGGVGRGQGVAQRGALARPASAPRPALPRSAATAVAASARDERVAQVLAARVDRQQAQGAPRPGRGRRAARRPGGAASPRSSSGSVGDGRRPGRLRACPGPRPQRRRSRARWRGRSPAAAAARARRPRARPSSTQRVDRAVHLVRARAPGRGRRRARPGPRRIGPAALGRRRVERRPGGRVVLERAASRAGDSSGGPAPPAMRGAPRPAAPPPGRARRPVRSGDRQDQLAEVGAALLAARAPRRPRRAASPSRSPAPTTRRRRRRAGPRSRGGSPSSCRAGRPGPP